MAAEDALLVSRARVGDADAYAALLSRHQADLTQFARERFGLAGVSELTAEEAAVVVREHGRLLTEQLGAVSTRPMGYPLGAPSNAPTGDPRMG